MSKVKCPKCGSLQSRNARFCADCGASLQKDAPSGPEKAVPNAAKEYMVIFLVAFVALVVAMVYNFRLISRNSSGSHVHDQQTTVKVDEKKLKELEDHARKHPNEPAPLVDLGNFFFDAGDFEKAIAYYEHALMLDQESPDVWVDLGVSYFNTRQLEEAEKCFLKALDYNQRHEKAMYNLGVVYHMQNRVNDMIRIWEKLIQTSPQSPEARQAMQFLDQIKNNVEG